MSKETFIVGYKHSVVPGSKVLKCCLCGEDVAVSPATLAAATGRDAKPLCLVCAKKKMDEGQMRKAMPLTEGQRRELIKSGVPESKIDEWSPQDIIDLIRESAEQTMLKEMLDKSIENGTAIEFGPEEIKEFKKLYDDALAKGDGSFTFRGHEIVTGYAKYVLEYLESLMEQKQKRRF